MCHAVSLSLAVCMDFMVCLCVCTVYDQTHESTVQIRQLFANSQLGMLLTESVGPSNTAAMMQGRLSIPFKEITRSKRIKDNFSLQGVRHGQLTLSLSWLGISDAK